MKRSLGLVLFLLTFFVSATAFGFEKGDRILALYEDAYWYPGTVQAVNGDVLTILFDDGERITVDAPRVEKLDWQAGDKVECRWPGNGKMYPGRFTEVKGNSVRIVYDDGDKANVELGKCRQSRESRLIGR